MITTAQFDDLVKNAKVKWREGYDLIPAAARTLYEVNDTDEMTSEHSNIDGPGFAKRKLEGQRYAIGSPKQGYSLILSQTRIGLMEAVTWEMRRFDKYNKIMKLMRGLGKSTAQRIELDLTHLFTFGLSAASYTNMDGETVSTVTGDGQNIFDTDHTITGGSGTYSNKITAQFSKDALEEAERLFVSFVNDNGQKISIMPDTIVTTDDPTLVNAVAEFLKSQKSPEDSRNAENVYKGKYKHLILPYLATDANGAPDSTKKNYWFLACVGETSAILEVSENPTFTAPNKGNNGEVFDTDDWEFKSSACYDYGVLDYKWLVGSTGTT